MANVFTRAPIAGGDDNSWSTYLMALVEAGGIGALTANLYNDGGALKLSAGRIGINDGTNKGVCELDTIQTISLAGVTNQNWAKIEVSVSGTSVTVAASDIAAATDPAELPATFKNAYNPEKGGFYITATKRTIGLVWKAVDGVLVAVINTITNQNKWMLTQLGRHDATIYSQAPNKVGILIPIGNWNMDSTASIAISTSTSNFNLGVADYLVSINNDAGSGIYQFSDGNPGPNIFMATGGSITLTRLGGGFFDSVNFDSSPYNRGYIILVFKDF